MSLEEYNKKRKFDKTSEPKGVSDKSNEARFVIQRHDASHLHYDLRLEMDGVLKSWAVPKGPSMNPDDKRLAVQTEDHPVKYLTFKGTIPNGNYGAGEMSIWDNGTFTINPTKDGKKPIDQFEKGNLKINFQGSKIKGDFALVKTHFGEKKNNWLLIKKADEYAVHINYDPEVFATGLNKLNHSIRKNSPSKKINKAEESKMELVKPMLAKTGKTIFDNKDWIYELKWDGYRLMAAVNKDGVELYSRNGLSQNVKFSPLIKELKNLPHEVLLDGEVVILKDSGISDFQKLQNYNGDEKVDLVYYVFDLIFLNGHSTTSLPLIDRKELLKNLIAASNSEMLRYCDHIETLGTAFFKSAVSEGFEGVMAKRASSEYYPGMRTDSWLKFKNVNDREAIICGYTDSDSSTMAFGSLILGAYEENELKYIGNCGSGFDATTQKELLKKMVDLETEESPFKTKPNLKGRTANWVIPEMICEVNYNEMTDNGMLRHPVYKRLRDDKTPHDVTEPEISENEEHQKEEGTDSEAPEKHSDTESSLLINGQNVFITNPEKVYFPKKGIRKYDVIDYYIQIADTILPYLKDRPQNLHRHPNGIEHPGFYQKDNENLPEWIKTISLYSKSATKDIDYLLCQDEATLVFMANLGCIELNPWNSTIQNLQNPTYTVLDIDPAEKTHFSEVVEVALVAKEILDKAKVKAYCKTSGSTGLHIYIPLAGEYTYDDARSFVKLICHFVQDRLPTLTTMERPLKSRKGKIYLDYLQNNRGQTLASSYCVRPREGATVSTPLEWGEVKPDLKITDHNIFTIPKRIGQKGDIFKNTLAGKTDLEKALNHLMDS